MSSAVIRESWSPEQATSVVVATGARLHFGLLGVRAVLGRRYGGVGLMLDQPGCRVRVTTASRDEIVVTDNVTDMADRDEWSRRLAGWRDRLRTSAGDRPCGAVRMALEQTIPAHRGFGSGTQTALAIGTALAAAWGWDDAAVSEIARWLGRGGRSTIGTVGFATGGFLIDAGHAVEATGDVPADGTPAVTRYDLPPEWRVLLVEPTGESGVSGEAETRAFAELPPMPAELTDRLCRLLLLELLPAVAAGQVEPFSRGLAEYGRAVGAYFAAAQGGAIFASPLIARLDAELVQAGHAGLVQTSWGPAAVTFAANETAARDLEREIIARIPPGELRTTVTRPLAAGAAVRFVRSGRNSP
jgi:beta-ribofuranosylaminobenzene 5'-phosphate synthase